MDNEGLYRAVREFERLFNLDLGDYLSDLEEALADKARRFAADDGSYDDTMLPIRRILLEELAKTPSLALALSRVFTDFRRQQEEEREDYVYFDSRQPLEQDELETLFDLEGLWRNLPVNLVHEHWDMVKKAAVRQHRLRSSDNDLELSDLLSAGSEALFKAAQKMYEDPKKEDFRTFAWKILKDKLKSEQSRRHPVPLKTRKKLEQLKIWRDNVGHYGTDAEDLGQIAEHMKISPEEVQGLAEIETVWGGGYEVDLYPFMEDFEVRDLSPDALTLLISQEEHDKVEQALAELTDIQRSTIRHIYFQDMSLSEAAERMAVPLHAVKKSHKKALSMLKKIFDEI